MSDEQRKQQDHEMPDFPAQRDDSPYAALNDDRGAPGGARRDVRSDSGQGTAARPGGANQNPPDAQQGSDEELTDGPGRGAD
jgi:hypothetical protein